MDQNTNSSLFSLNLDAQNSYTLRSALSWAKVLAILGFIFGALIGFMGYKFYSGVSNARSFSRFDRSSDVEAGATLGLGLFVLYAALTIIGSLFAFSFANKTALALRNNDQNNLRTGFAQLRNYFAYWSILMIIGLFLTLLGMPGFFRAWSD